MEIEQIFVLVFLIPAIVLFSRYFEKTIDLSDPKLHFLFGWFFYGFAVPIDYILGLKIIQPWDVVDYGQEKFFYGMIYVMLMYYTVYIGFSITYRDLTLAKSYRPPSYFTPLTLPFIIIVSLLLAYLAVSFDEIMTMSRMDRNTQLVNTEYRLFRFLETAIIIISCIFILYHKNLKKVHILTLLVFLLGILSGDRSSLVVPALAWLVRIKLSIKTSTFVVLVTTGIFLLFIWKAMYSFVIAYSLGKDVDIQTIFSAFSLSLIDPVGPFNLATWVISDWGIGELYGGYTVFILPVLRALPRFIFDIDAPTLAESFLHRYLPHIEAAGGGRAFGIVAEFYLNFYIIGPLIFGLIWGTICSYVRRVNSPIILLIFLICNFRIFRSDVASVFKSYIILFGVTTLLWFILSYFLKEIQKLGDDEKEEKIPNSSTSDKP